MVARNVGSFASEPLGGGASHSSGVTTEPGHVPSLDVHLIVINTQDAASREHGVPLPQSFNPVGSDDTAVTSFGISRTY